MWTAKAVRQLIYREFGRQLDLSTVRRYLRSWGMTPQRPKKKAIQQDDAAVQRWLETDYPAIAERAKKEKATIFGKTKPLSSRTPIGSEATRRAERRRRSFMIAAPATALPS